jgi:ABC-type Zn uptake system ZnuABC Zn-binding protein ZnuA
MLRRTILALFLTAPLALTGCTRKPVEAVWPDKSGPKVVVTFAPLHSFATAVMGDRGHVKTILAAQGPHEYQPTAEDAKTIDGADLFFHNGLGLEGTLVPTIQKARPGTKVKFVDLGAKIPKYSLLDMEGDHDHGAAGHDHGHGIDPHVWLGLDNVKVMVQAIRDELKAADPSFAAEYDKNAAAYLETIEKLREEGKQLLSAIPKDNRKFVTMHDSLGYFSKTFDLSVAGVIELSPGQEPSTKELEELIEACTKNKVRVIALEPQYSSAGGAKTLERELKRKGLDPILIDIDPLETADPAALAPELYVKTMRANLKALAEALAKK